MLLVVYRRASAVNSYTSPMPIMRSLPCKTQAHVNEGWKMQKRDRGTHLRQSSVSAQHSKYLLLDTSSFPDQWQQDADGEACCSMCPPPPKVENQARRIFQASSQIISILMHPSFNFRPHPSIMTNIKTLSGPRHALEKGLDSKHAKI